MFMGMNVYKWEFLWGASAEDHWFWLKIDNFGCNNNIGLNSVEIDQFRPKSNGFGQHFKTLVLVTYSYLKIGFLFNKKDGMKCNKKK